MSEIISDGKVVSLAYTLTVDGEAFEEVTEADPVEYLHGKENIVPGLENALAGHQVGDQLQVTVTPDEGYGDYDDTEVIVYDLDDLPDADQLAEGMVIVVEDDDGFLSEAVVMEMDDETVTLDFNPPLAGKTLTFDVRVLAVRDADEEELEQGIPHSLELDDTFFDDDEFDDEFDDDEEYEDEDEA